MKLLVTKNTPTRMASDADTWMWYKFNEARGSTTIVNYGALGATGDLARSHGTEGTGYDFVPIAQDARSIFGSSLVLVAGYGINTSARFHTGLSVAYPASNYITISTIITPINNAVGGTWPAGGAVIFWKEYNEASWSAPYQSIGIGAYDLGSTGYFDFGQLFGKAYANPNTNDIIQVGRAKYWNHRQLHTLVYQQEWGGLNRRLWLDGYLIGSNTTDAPNANKYLGTGRWGVGASYGGAADHFSCFLHEVRVDTVLRSQAWVTEHFQRANGLI